MASTKRTNLEDDGKRGIVKQQLKQFEQQLKQKVDQLKDQYGEDFEMENFVLKSDVDLEIGSEDEIDPKVEEIKKELEKTKGSVEFFRNQYYKVLKEKEELDGIKPDSNEEVTSETPELSKYDFINPVHYDEDDGRETYEHMIDKWGKEAVALWCEMTAFKYKRRMGKKPTEDMERELNKMEWYVKKAKEIRLSIKRDQDKDYWTGKSLQ